MLGAEGVEISPIIELDPSVRHQTGLRPPLRHRALQATESIARGGASGRAGREKRAGLQSLQPTPKVHDALDLAAFEAEHHHRPEHPGKLERL